MLGQSRAFADAARAAGADVSLTPWTGGHDYAWWRRGLFASLRGLNRERNLG
ncbi:hypothetical protein HQQ81_01855 [Microbacteriaceae bacterium VKM Ac-2854]|nr:hypothetical protein [Microbacteriaceae bacterium VKM Ac-2854]